MAAPTEAPDTDALRTRILACVDEVKDPCSVTAGDSLGLAEMGLVKSVDISADGEVTLTLRLTSPFCEMIGYLKSESIEKIEALPSVRFVRVRTDSGCDWSPDDMAPHARRRREERLMAARAEAGRGVPLPIEPVGHR